MSTQHPRRGSSPADTGGRYRSPWFAPIRSEESARLLADLVVERSAVAGRALNVDVAHGVVESVDGRWSATLAPLAVRVAGVPPSGWPTIVDWEIRRWLQAAANVGELGRSDGSASLRRPTAVIRLTQSPEPAGRSLRAAYGHVAWEIVYDVGTGILLGRDPTAAVDGGVTPEEAWSQVAAATVRRSRERWSRLEITGLAGLVLGGPYVTSLLFDPLELRQEIGAQEAALRVSVFGNDLLLIAAGEDGPRPELAAVSESLVRYGAAAVRPFAPFSTMLT